ncbi:hypothetical protein Poly51_54760 [Rubripirellula tenax]|uniref:PKD domain-containing protein n=1 Tax=Rubripirellula tenax TaxID=2528015 RepID=A0A5C6EEC8_9BACT|nr:dockerin type I domain-containing protein [Rubripirellula tenax]TWU46081.1 hypothetical protein Poly51_54760 [Rubripirellula tenax]
MMIAEGDSFSLSIPVSTAGLVGDATALIDWGDGTTSTGTVTGGNATGNIKIVLDYSLDSSGFFGNSASDPRRVKLQQAADAIVSRFTDTLDAVTPKQFVTVKPRIFHPSQGSPAKVEGDLFALPENPTIAANTIIVYAGARDLPAGTAGVGGGASISFSRTCIPGAQCNEAIANQNAIFSRGEPGVLASPATDIAPLYASISFDAPRKSLYYVGDDPSEIPIDGLDFLSIATHELAHALGFGTSDSWNTVTTSGSFAGTNAKAAYVGSGNVPLAPQHWAESVPAGQPSLMGPVIVGNARTAFSILDFAAMDDIGWDVVDLSATAAGNHVYADDGDYTISVTISGAVQGDIVYQDIRTVRVDNVAPTLTVVGNRTETVNQPFSIENIGTFIDPGFSNPSSNPATVEEFPFTIDWGDGTIDSGTATVDQLGGRDGTVTEGSFDGSHTYTTTGNKTVTVRVTDDNNGASEKMFTITVSEPPELILELDIPAIDEDQGADAATLTVRRTGAAPTTDQTITLSSSDIGEATVPATVVIPAGQTSATVSVAAVDDALLDGVQSVTISATGSGVSGGSVDVQVRDAESLSASFTGESTNEAGTPAIFFVLTRSNTDVDEAITVSVVGVNTTQLDLATSIELPAGVREVRLPVQPIDDDLPERSIRFDLTFSATNYDSASASFTLLDNEPAKFQNPVDRFDVSNGEGVTARDVLLVINQLARQTTPDLDPVNDSPGESFFDVNGDYQVTALDALQIINQLPRLVDEGSENLEAENLGSVSTEAVDHIFQSGDIFQAVASDWDLDDRDGEIRLF